MSEQKQKPSQPLLAGIEELVDQIFFVSDVPRQEIGYEQIGERVSMWHRHDLNIRVRPWFPST